ncbi:MAG: nucleotidyltransferase domain-containing protein [Candidatus Woesearchaeota archaeon]
MEFKIEKKSNENIHKYPTEYLKIARDFSGELKTELGDFLKGVILFGSSVRREATEKSDIDILVVTDDVSFVLTEPLVEAYRVIIESVIARVNRKLHVTSMTFTSFWEYAKAGDPVVVNILRDGIALYDNGFFDPLQRLLIEGRIRPTEESVWRYFGRAPKTLTNSRWHLLQATLDLYWAVIDSAHAALMRKNQIPPTPDHAADMLEEVFVKKKLLEAKYVKTMRKFYEVSKKITHREIEEISGSQYEDYFKEASAFVDKMKFIIEKN